MMINFILPILFYSFLGMPSENPSQTGRVVMVNPTMGQVKQMAEGENKLALLYFTGQACINSRNFETNILQNTEVSKYLAANMISAVFYVDDKTKLRESEQKDDCKTIGERNAKIQSRYKSNLQPFVIVIDHIGKMLYKFEDLKDPKEFLNQLKNLKD